MKTKRTDPEESKPKASFGRGKEMYPTADCFRGTRHGVGRYFLAGRLLLQENFVVLPGGFGWL